MTVILSDSKYFSGYPVVLAGFENWESQLCFKTYKFYNAKLADFGLAKEYDKHESMRNNTYLEGYSEPISTNTLLPWPIMAPELLCASFQMRDMGMGRKGKFRFFTESTDMWSFGILSAEFVNLREGSCRICDNSDSLTTIFSEDMNDRKVLRSLE